MRALRASVSLTIRSTSSLLETSAATNDAFGKAARPPLSDVLDQVDERDLRPSAVKRSAIAKPIPARRR